MADDNNTDITLQDEQAESGKKSKPQKEKPIKAHRMTKEEKAAAREAQKQKSQRQKEWEDSLVANKRVKREEFQRKLKRALAILLVFALIVTSVVYIMLMFIEENNIRITASSNGEGSIMLSFDRTNWTPYLDVQGPNDMWNISYNPTYEVGNVPSILDIERMFLIPGELVGGNKSEPNLIQFCFYLSNSGNGIANYSYEMVLASNDKGLEKTLRVLWGTSVIGTAEEQPDRPNTSVICYAMRSDDPRLAYNTEGADGQSYEGGGIEKISYPKFLESGFTTQQLQMYEHGRELGPDGQYKDVNLRSETGGTKYLNVSDYLNDIGYVNTAPFVSNNTVLSGSSYLFTNEILCVYVCIWIEGSDFDCKDNVLDGYVSLAINFSM